MKKIYIDPTTEIVSVHLCGMLATSDPNVKVDDTENVDAGLVESRRRNRTVWDDEEEQEEDF